MSLCARLCCVCARAPAVVRVCARLCCVCVCVCVSVCVIVYVCCMCCHRVRCVSISNKYSHDELCHCRRCYLSVFFNLVVRENSIRGLAVVPAVLVSHSTIQTVLTTCLDCGCLPPFKQFHSNSLDSGCRLWCHRLVSLCEAWERLTTTRLDHFAIPGDALVEPSVMVASSRAHTRGTSLVSVG